MWRGPQCGYPDPPQKIFEQPETPVKKDTHVARLTRGQSGSLLSFSSMISKDHGGWMSRLGHSRHFDRGPVTSGPPQLTDIPSARRQVSKAPTGDFVVSITSLRRALGVARRPFALRIGLRIADRLRLRVDLLGLRIADRLGQHLMEFSLGRCGTHFHLATISLSASRLPWPGAQPSIVRSFSRRLPALSRIRLLLSVYRFAETPWPSLHAPGPSSSYHS